MKINLSTAVAIIAATAVLSFGIGSSYGEHRAKANAEAAANARVSAAVSSYAAAVETMTAEWSMKTVNR